MTLKKTIYYLLLLFLFMLPWQTRWIYLPAYINGGWWEYGSESIYATQILLWLIIILFLIDRVKNRGGRGVLSRERDPASRRWQYAHTFGDSKNLMLSFWLGGVGQGLLAIWQFCSQSTFAYKWLGLASHAAANFNGDFVIETSSGRWLRAYGAFGSPNILGGFLAVCLIMGLIICLRFVKGERQFAPTRDWRRGVLLYALMVGQLIIFSGLILSFSRGSWIAAGVGIIVVAVVGARGRAPLRSLAKHFLFYLVVILFFIISLYPIFTTRLTGAGRLEQRSVSERIGQLTEWRGVWLTTPPFKEGAGGGQLQQHDLYLTLPLKVEGIQRALLGVGPGAYTATLYRLNPTQPSYYYQPIHNTYLLMIAEVGIVGFAIAFLLFGFLVFLIWRSNPLYISVIAVLLVSALFDHFWWSLYTGQVIFLAVLGLGLVSNWNNGVTCK